MATRADSSTSNQIPGFEVDDAATDLFNSRAMFQWADEPGAMLATKEGDMVMYADQEGNLRHGELGMGLYFRDTRFLSNYSLKIGGRNPVLLSSSAERAFMSYVDLTNPTIGEGATLVQEQTINIRRTRVIKGRLFDRTRFKNYNTKRLGFRVSFSFASDFADIFHVRGLVTERSGTFFTPRIDGSIITFAHRGEDGAVRQLKVDLGQEPDAVEPGVGAVTVHYDLDLVAGQTKVLTFILDPVIDGEGSPEVSFDEAIHELRRSYDEWDRRSTRIETDNELFNSLLKRGRRDLRALLTETPDGRYIAAGIPWYIAAFGRDSLITAHQILLLDPEPARDTLRMLAQLQGDRVDPWRDEEPGKILHEIRTGELARAGVVPHTPYYGSVDSTPLWLILYGTYFKWTADRALAEELLPNVRRALEWIDTYGDADGDGFVEYERKSERGLDNHGWKDSVDSIAHDDGTLAEGPIALAEVQAYVYLAKIRTAEVFEVLGHTADADRLRAEAARLKRRFNEAFWMEDEGFFALALDGEKRQVRSVTSNPGHGLYCGIIDDDRVDAVAKRMLEPDMFSGWGVRTMSKGSAAYNPMSYHNGSVWPHDNAFIAAGLKRYRNHRQTNRLASALFDAAVVLDYMRLPELFCGFTRRTPNQPVRYPVACSPQAWAAGSPFLMLQAMLGLSAVAHENLLTVNIPSLPAWLNWVEIHNLRVGDSTLSMVFRREGETTAFSLLTKEGSVRVIMEE